MRRNLFGRIETCTPVLNEALKQRVIREGLTLALQDNEKAWQMNSDGTYQRIRASENEPTIGLQSLLLNEYQA